MWHEARGTLHVFGLTLWLSFTLIGRQDKFPTSTSGHNGTQISHLSQATPNKLDRCLSWHQLSVHHAFGALLDVDKRCSGDVVLSSCFQGLWDLRSSTKLKKSE